MSVGLAVAFLTVAVPAGATTPKPTVSGFAASPTTLYNNGGIVTLSANVTNAMSCVFSSTKPVAGLPATVACTSGEVSQAVTLPANTGKKPVKYKFKLAVTGTKTVEAKAVSVTVGTSALLPPLTGVRSVASDADGYCAVLSTGGVDCWGYNYYGELGNGSTGGPDGKKGYDTPQAVTGITNAVSVAGNGTDSGDVGFAGGYCAVLSTGGVDCWGYNNDGELGNGTTGGPDGEDGYDTPQAVTGITNAVSLSSEGYGKDFGYCAVLSTGGVDCWGYNDDGDLGNGTIDGPDGADGYDTPQSVTGITTAVSVSSEGYGNDFGYCAMLSTGGVDCWGDNFYGELGNGTTGGPDDCVSEFSGDYCYDTPQAVTGISSAVSVASHDNGLGYCAVLSTGGMNCWGWNGDGELGNGTTGGPDGADGYDTPQAVTGITTAVSAASDGDGYCAVLSAGGVDCWGDNLNGDLGNGTTGGPDGEDGYDTPQAVTGITTAVSATGDFGVDLGYCALLSTGGMDCWGDNLNGNLGNGTTGGPDGEDGYDTPQAVTGITNSVSVAGGFTRDYCAVLSTGGVDCWGYNYYGELGNGTTAGPDGGGYDTPQAVSAT